MIFGGSPNPWHDSSLIAVPIAFALILPDAILVSLALRICVRKTQHLVQLGLAVLWICTALCLVASLDGPSVPTVGIPASLGVLVAACVAFKSAVPFGLVLIAVAAGAMWVPVLKQVKDLSFLLVLLAMAVTWNVVAGGGLLVCAWRWRPPLAGRCPKCGYSLAGLPSGAACPECGQRNEARP